LRSCEVAEDAEFQHGATEGHGDNTEKKIKTTIFTQDCVGTVQDAIVSILVQVGAARSARDEVRETVRCKRVATTDALAPGGLTRLITWPKGHVPDLS
jgi:hypothetical protein